MISRNWYLLFIANSPNKEFGENSTCARREKIANMEQNKLISCFSRTSFWHNVSSLDATQLDYIFLCYQEKKNKSASSFDCFVLVSISVAALLWLLLLSLLLIPLRLDDFIPIHVRVFADKVAHRYIYSSDSHQYINTSNNHILLSPISDESINFYFFFRKKINKIHLTRAPQSHRTYVCFRTFCVFEREWERVIVCRFFFFFLFLCRFVRSLVRSVTD